MNVLKSSINGFSYQAHKTSSLSSHLQMRFPCPSLSRPKSRSIRVSERLMIYLGPVIPLLKVALGPSLKMTQLRAILIKQRLSSQRRTRSGTILERRLQRQGHSLPRTPPNQDIIPKAISWTRSPSQSTLSLVNLMPRLIQRISTRTL